MESIEKLRKLPYHGTNGFGSCVTASKETIDQIADEIEAEISERYMPLPLDSDGVPCKVGDMVEFKGREYEVFGVSEDGVYVNNGDVWMVLFPRGDMHHAKPRTIEDVLEEFGSKMHGITTEERERLVNEAADEIRGMK